MADNVAITAGSGTTIAADDVSSVYYQRVKIDLGGDGAASPLVRGQQANADSLPVTLSTEQAAFLDGIEAKLDTVNTNLGIIDGRVDTLETLIAATNTKLDTLNNGGAVDDYETVAASQTNQALGATGAAGDFLASVLIVPASTSPGAVTIKDGSNSAITIFAGGTSSVSNLVPFLAPIGAVSVQGAWQITTGANVSVISFGRFT